MTMTPLIYMLALIISIVILLVLTLKLKMNSFMALFFTAMGLSVFFGTSPIESLNNITGSFGKSLGSIGLPVLFGAILAMGVQDSGAAVAISNFFVTLTLKEFELLKLLVLSRGKVLTRDFLLDRIWGYEFYGETRTVDVHIRHIRQKLGDDARYIETIRGVGYKFNDKQENRL